MKFSNIPTVLVIFGATGDLMRRKLSPALFELHKKGKLPDRFKILAFSRRNFSDEEFRKHLAGELKAYHKISAADLKKSYLALYQYVSGDFEDNAGYKKLTDIMKQIDDGWGVCTNKLFYLAVSPGFYKRIFTDLHESGLTKPCSPEEGWTRIIVEKPFGEDFETAQKLDELLGKLFREVQIYRIDHYLAKEMLQNILAFRFSNNLLESNWSSESIENIEIRLWEKIGVEKRGSFYDRLGALRDVGQNHLLQMLALVTMDLPLDFTPEGIRRARSEILKTLKIPTAADLKKNAVRAQYRGYRSIDGVEKGSNTETYFKIRAKLESSRWSGVPIFMEAGKRIGEQRKEVVVRFRHPNPCLCMGSEHHRNKITFSLEPDERITIRFWSKKPGLDVGMEERTFDFLLRDRGARVQYVEEYEKLLLDCITGDQTLFVSTAEVKAMWKFIDPVVRSWKNNNAPLHTYFPDTMLITRKMPVEAQDVGKRIPALSKEIVFVGLGKMGMNMARRLLGRGWRVWGYDVNSGNRRDFILSGGHAVESIASVSQSVRAPRVYWLMLPAGGAVDKVLGELSKGLNGGDIVIDGGNSFYIDSIRRAKQLRRKKIFFVDVGASGGPEGAKRGLSIMGGGERKIYEKLIPLFEDLALPGGFAYMGGSGAGHFAKMVHNGIEYGMMQSIAEGFMVLKRAPFKFSLKRVAGVYNRGSVIESRLLGWLGAALGEFGEDLGGVSGAVGHTGEGEWTIKTAKKLKVPVPIIERSFKFRKASARSPSYAGKILSSLRGQFGGHSVKNSKI